MPDITANGITIHYDDHGPADAEPILLIMGFGAQMTLWPQELVDALADHGFRVIRHDNRDIGLSHKFDGVKAPGMVRMALMRKFGFKPKAPYGLMTWPTTAPACSTRSASTARISSAAAWAG